jgi:uncharacterized secreted protein with C-terminal beta-propeller domain
MTVEYRSKKSLEGCYGTQACDMHERPYPTSERHETEPVCPTCTSKSCLAFYRLPVDPIKEIQTRTQESYCNKMADDMNAMEEGGAADPRPTNGASTSSGNRKKWIVAGAAVAVVSALALGLGFGLSGDNSKSNNSLEDNSKGTGTNAGNGNSGSSFGNGIPISSKLTAISAATITQKYPSCDDLAKDLTEMAWLIANRTIESNLWFFNPDSYYYPPVSADGGEADAGTQAAPADSSSSNKQVSKSNYGTNNQVAGVEEGDIVQSNGQQVFVVYGSEILVLAADAVTLTSRTTVPTAPNSKDCYSNYIANMLLIGDRLVVISSSYCGGVVPLEGDVAAKSSSLYPIGVESLQALIYDITDMSVLTTVVVNGTYVAARAIGDDVYIVTSSYLDSYPLTQYLEPWNVGLYGSNLTEAVYRRKAKAQVEAHVDEYVASLLKTFDCKGVTKLALFQNSNSSYTFTSVLDSVATVTSFTVSSPAATKTTSSVMLPSGGFTVYASAQQLILAVQGWWVGDAASQQTYLISFTLDGPSANATGFGTVPGYVLNQFSIDHAVQGGVDYLRVATSTFEQWAEVNGTWSVVSDSTSKVTVLKKEDGVAEMSVVGKLTNLGKTGETIYSVRFIGNRGFITTFKTTDPFYTIDLSDPTNPTKVGELEIPGFSNYLQEVGDNLILGVGQAADSNGTVLGVEISLFDVSDFSNPVRVQQYADVGSTNLSSSSYSDAQYDWKSLRYLNSSQLLILPVTVYTYAVCNYTSSGVAVSAVDGGVATGSDGNSSSIPIDPVPYPCYEPAGGFDGFRVYDIKSSGIAPYLSIAHDLDDWYGCWSGAYLQSRSLVFDGDLMTLKGHSILSYDLSTRTQDATPINLDNNVSVCEPYILF